MKRGQATLFVIAGILIAAVAILSMAYKEQISQQLIKSGFIKKEALDIEADKIEQQIGNCLGTITGNAVLHVAENGGYLLKTSDNFAYYAKNDKLIAPAASQLEESISLYVSQMMPTCIVGESFNALVEPGGFAKTRTELSDDKIKVYVQYPIEISYEGSSVLRKDFSSENNMRIGRIYNIAVSIADQHKDKSGVCLSCLERTSTENSLKIDVYKPTQSEDTFFVITDKTTTINSKPLVYIFAMKLEGTAS